MLSDFIHLYNVAPKIAQLKVLPPQEYRAFATKQGLPVALVSLEKHLPYIPHVEYLYKFYREAGIFWLIPSDTPSGEIAGFILRAYSQKLYINYFPSPKVPQYVFGFSTWRDFKPNDIVFITEGVKDCLYLQQFYPYVLTTLTANISPKFVPFLKTLTQRVVLAFDNDYSGKRAVADAAKNLTDFEHHACLPHLQDWGCYFDRPDLTHSSRIYLNHVLSLFQSRDRNMVAAG